MIVTVSFDHTASGRYQVPTTMVWGRIARATTATHGRLLNQRQKAVVFLSERPLWTKAVDVTDRTGVKTENG